MRIVEAFDKFRGGWPGGYEKYARGWNTGSLVDEFHPATDPDDVRTQIPPLGMREYWYPAMPARKLGSRKPVGIKLLGEDVVVFRGQGGDPKALMDVCPHRGVRLSMGDCFWPGFVTCPYHGATFDGDGRCVEFVTEGPDSSMVGQLEARALPTATLKGVVFIWMGQGEPVPIEEDVPPEFFDDETIIFQAWRYWSCNWMVALENTLDAHNAGFVHRNSLRMLKSRTGGRPRTPRGYRSRIVNNKVVHPLRDAGTHQYYFDENGRMPYQLHYPRVDGVWPLNRYRLLWTWLFERIDKRKFRHPEFELPEEWVGQRLPGIVRNKHWDTMYTRWCIPVEENLTRVFYMYGTRPRTLRRRIWEYATWPFYNFIVHFNFSDQDYDAMRTTRYDTPEYLSPTDSYLVALRRLMVEHGRRYTPPASDDAETVVRVRSERSRTEHVSG